MYACMYIYIYIYTHNTTQNEQTIHNDCFCFWRTAICVKEGAHIIATPVPLMLIICPAV